METRAMTIGNHPCSHDNKHGAVGEAMRLLVTSVMVNVLVVKRGDRKQGLPSHLHIRMSP